MILFLGLDETLCTDIVEACKFSISLILFNWLCFVEERHWKLIFVSQFLVGFFAPLSIIQACITSSTLFLMGLLFMTNFMPL